MTHDVRIAMDTPTRGRVFVDGKELKGILSFEIVAKAGQLHRLTISIMPKSVAVTGLADVIEKHAALA